MAGVLLTSVSLAGGPWAGVLFISVSFVCCSVAGVLLVSVSLQLVGALLISVFLVGDPLGGGLVRFTDDFVCEETSDDNKAHLNGVVDTNGGLYKCYWKYYYAVYHSYFNSNWKNASHNLYEEDCEVEIWH